MSRVVTLLDDALGQEHFPSCSYIISRGRDVLAAGAAGHACLLPEKVEAGPNTIYDLASLTKPLCTSLLALLLKREGIVRFEDPVRRYVPAYAKEGRGDILVVHLLTHSSGLPAWEPLYLAGYERREILQRLDEIGLEYATGSDAVYSCLGYIQLGRIFELAAGDSLDRLFRDLVAKPLSLESAAFCPGAELRPRIAATEAGNELERRLCGDHAADYRGFRTGVIRGEVHDHNSYSLGGISGNAGLFATAADVWRIAVELADPQGLLRPDEARMCFENMTGEASDHRSIALQLGSATTSVTRTFFSSKAGAHVGTTGTSLAVDPVTSIVAVLLTNRVHPHYREFNMNELRRQFHEAVAADCGLSG